uniref:Protein draper-like isoform X1 n=2 Tax=Crassostrea virginica TaxID=6565 RepID=A0A8B8CCD0_CRAVI|nr:protein draper-like isoform X1 [Crassostrea virginica]
MAQFKLIWMYQICIFGIIVIISHCVEGRCRIFPNNTHVCLCHCENNCMGGCQICDKGYGGSRRIFCQKQNIVFGQPSAQENNYSKQFDSSKAVDGDMTTYCKVQERSEGVWWRVDLNTHRAISTINITMDTIAGVEYYIYVIDESMLINKYSLCKSTKTVQAEKNNLMLNCKSDMIGKAIEIHTPPQVPLKIYEVSLNMCTDGTYGEECDSLCPRECNNTCNKKTGECDRCPLGFTSGSCNRTCSSLCGSMGCNIKDGRCVNCANGFWGKDCTKRCSRECHSVCQRESGYCKECSSGYAFNGSTCVQCPSGSFGNSCASKCDANCKDGLCVAESGDCTDCSDGKYGKKCQNNCSEKCLNSSCSASTGKCFHCAVGYEGLECKQCLVGYFGKACRNMCTNNCKKHDCDHLTGACFSCEDGMYGPYCNQTCPSVCKDRKCLQNGECVACKNGRYGLKCEFLCPPVWCSRCDKKTGLCFECQSGRYGSDCLKTCMPECRNGCSITNGSCGQSRNIPLLKTSNANLGMVNIIILTGTTFLIVFSVVFLAKICRMQKERNGSKRRSHRGVMSWREQSSSQRYRSLEEEPPYQNTTVENQAVAATESANNTGEASATTSEEVNEARESVANLSKLYQRIVSFDEVQIRRQRNLSSDSSLPYENVDIKNNDMVVTYSKY